MQGLPNDLIAAVGQVTIAAGDLELILAVVAAHQGESGGDSFMIMAKPGEPLRAARRSVQSLPVPYRGALLLAVEDASNLLSERHAVVHAMWVSDHVDTDAESWELLHFKTHIKRPASAEILEELAVRLLETRNRVVKILTAYINTTPLA